MNKNLIKGNIVLKILGIIIITGVLLTTIGTIIILNSFSVHDAEIFLLISLLVLFSISVFWCFLSWLWFIKSETEYTPRKKVKCSHCGKKISRKDAYLMTDFDPFHGVENSYWCEDCYKEFTEDMKTPAKAFTDVKPVKNYNFDEAVAKWVAAHEKDCQNSKNSSSDVRKDV